jgi:hypothetical protein
VNFFALGTAETSIVTRYYRKEPPRVSEKVAERVVTPAVAGLSKRICGVQQLMLEPKD